ncbi:hypothetical protein [Paenirhodobacter sp. CAU 1674]|uniref:hypothetical protein n=1 Tax=Paenirhodobacter sp. CAU 1674 TaxID=3032596 RepID=UPI0023DBF646|nr:hypothetical protein [Paenirhodobacter sp. CAU 1674]MDF2139925.1 hypothetical protein [Paenirhodobacter sp. CAU 1674]
MSRTHHHIFLAAPGFGPLGACVARSLALGRAALTAAGTIHVDETLMGRAGAGLSGFFPMAPQRMRRFATKIQGPVGRVVLLTQSYDTYFPQIWRHQAQRRAMPDFGDIAPALVRDQRGWADLVAEVLRELKPRDLVVLPAPVTPAEVLAALAPGVALPVAPLDTVQLPDTGLAMLQRLLRAGVSIAPRQAQRLMAFHAEQPQPAPLAGFGVLEAARLRRRYEQDLDRIAAMPGVRIGAMVPLAIAAE